jgi:hypothetical protein
VITRKILPVCTGRTSAQVCIDPTAGRSDGQQSQRSRMIFKGAPERSAALDLGSDVDAVSTQVEELAQPSPTMPRVVLISAIVFLCGAAQEYPLASPTVQGFRRC